MASCRVNVRSDSCSRCLTVGSSVRYTELRFSVQLLLHGGLDGLAIYILYVVLFSQAALASVSAEILFPERLRRCSAQLIEFSRRHSCSDVGERACSYARRGVRANCRPD